MEKKVNFLEKPENIRLRGKTPDDWCKIDKDNNYGGYTLEFWSYDYAPVLGMLWMELVLKLLKKQKVRKIL